MIQVKRLAEGVPLPVRMTSGSAGFDMHSPVAFSLYPGEEIRLPMGFAWELPQGSVGRLEPRSSLARRKLAVLGGVIDWDYRGEVIAILCNNSGTVIKVDIHERVVQLLVLWLHPASVAIGNPTEVDELTDTVRGTGGFGSTNKA